MWGDASGAADRLLDVYIIRSTRQLHSIYCRNRIYLYSVAALFSSCQRVINSFTAPTTEVTDQSSLSLTFTCIMIGAFHPFSPNNDQGVLTVNINLCISQ
jgi:hypothetical protein